MTNTPKLSTSALISSDTSLLTINNVPIFNLYRSILSSVPNSSLRGVLIMAIDNSLFEAYLLAFDAEVVVTIWISSYSFNNSQSVSFDFSFADTINILSK